MRVTFTRTGERRYRISVTGPGVVESWMEPAPGYDARLPHDMAHFVVENELGIKGGVFGQLAAGGTANTFHPVDEARKRNLVKRGRKIAARERKDALLSERCVAVACGRWTNDPLAPKMAEGVAEHDIERICRAFDMVSAKWRGLRIGESMVLTWSGETRTKVKVPRSAGPG